MDLGQPLIEYGNVEIGPLLDGMSRQAKGFWEIDRASRIKLAGDRPGNAVYHYNDMPPCVSRYSLMEIGTGYLSVRRYSERPLFAEIQALIEAAIMPRFPGCDIMRVQLAELPPGAVITPHSDKNILARIHRLHVPLITHERVAFFIAGQRYFLRPAELYDLNNVVMHSVNNQSNVMRIHLMVDMMPHTVARARYYDTDEAIVAATASLAARA